MGTAKAKIPAFAKPVKRFENQNKTAFLFGEKL